MTQIDQQKIDDIFATLEQQRNKALNEIIALKVENMKLMRIIQTLEKRLAVLEAK